MNDMTSKSLKELAEVLLDTNSTQAQIENATYEIGFRQEMLEVMARGGIRPNHQPPH